MPDLAYIEQALRTTAIYGAAFVFLCGFLGLALWLGVIVVRGIRDAFDIGREWVPQVAKEHVTFLKETKAATAKTAQAIETFTATKSAEHRKTHRAISHLSSAAKEITDSPAAHKLIDRALEELRERDE